MDGGSGAAGLPEFVLKDLSQSGLRASDINARVLDSPERAATLTPYSVQGYVLPYFNMQGRPIPFYRVRLFDSDPKYRQPKDSQNHVYFPKLLTGTLEGKDYIIVTEGEKKAACLVNAGFPAVAFGGVDSWRNRTILIDADAQLAQHKKQLAVKLPSGSQAVEDYTAPLAVGMIDLMDLLKVRELNVIICFDSDQEKGVPAEVQRAAATLGYELRSRGIPFRNIRQLILPKVRSFDFTGDKVGADDFIIAKGKDAFAELVQACLAQRSAFPRHPNVFEYIGKRLQKSTLSRKEIQAVSLAILSDLDSRGLRLRDISNTTYFFDHKSKKLMAATWASYGDPNYDSPFTQFMYQEYGIAGADNRLMQWLGIQFSAEQPIEQVTPWRVFARPDPDDVKADQDCIYYQVSDSQYVKLGAEGLSLHANGENNILFESEQVDPLDVDKLFAEYRQQSQKPVSFWWSQTLAQVRLRDKDKQRVIAGLLYYMSPWLFRWRGMQLPIELIVGESGSGKSTLCELRLDILTGRPFLRNSPHDLKDWHASISNAGGLHVTDNVQLVDKALRNRLSDEICRIVTEPEPYIEQRKLYTNAELIRIPVRVCFALTAIQQPFQNSDLIQRAFILELDKSVAESEEGTIRYDSKWKSNQLTTRGGREGWIAHHLVVLNLFFQLVKQRWDNDYQAKQRLINFEQAMTILADVFGIPRNWVPDYLVQVTDTAIKEADWILEGIYSFAVQHYYDPTLKNRRFRVNTISTWCENQAEYKGNEMLTSPRKLGRYLQARKSAIFAITGIHEAGMEANRIVYMFKREPTRDRSSNMMQAITHL
jgi:hypothetical protein